MQLSELCKLNLAFKDVLFVEEAHVYKIKGEISNGSVTRLLKKYQQPFDAEFFAKKTAKRDGVSVNEVLALWDFKKEYSCHKGTTFHNYVENFLNRKQISVNTHNITTFCKANLLEESQYYTDLATYIKNFREFYIWWKERYVLIKTEFVIGDLEKRVGGTIDNLSYDPEKNELVIFDYKTNKSIETKNKYGTTLIGDLQHLSDCELVKYSLQMWIYALMLQKVVDIKVNPGYIVWVGGQYQLIKVLDLQTEARLILEKSSLD